MDELEKSHRVFFFQPYEWQKEAFEVVREKNTTGVISSNKIGKSCFVVNLLLSWLFGYEPWNEVDKDDPEAVIVGGVPYRKSSLGIEPPVDLILTGEDWKLHFGRTLVPEIKKWAPVGWYQTKKNEQGVEYIWEFAGQDGSFKNGSTLTLMTYSQDDDLFESFRAQGAVMDEPPPKSKYKAMSRGLLLDNGKTVLSLTPIKEAWILDDLVLSGRDDVGIVDGLKITDNPDLYGEDCEILAKYITKEQIDEFFELLLYDDKKKGKYVSDKGAKAEALLKDLIPVEHQLDIYRLKILKFIKDIDPDDVPPRVFGEFKSLVGRVLKEYSDDIHKVKPFNVPTDWPVVPMIDFHLSTPQAISYWSVDERDVEWCVGETWDNLSAKEIADDIIRKKTSGMLIKNAFIDPLSKGDTAYMKNQLGSDIEDAFTTISNRLSRHGITLHVASKDKKSGIKNIKERLRGPNRMPAVFIFDTCERHFFEVKRWVYDDYGEPAKENDHFMENWYRFTLTGTKYKRYRIRPLPPPVRSVAGGWLGA